jgi:hypothetical protein
MMTQEEKADAVLGVWRGLKPCLHCGRYIPERKHWKRAWNEFQPAICLCTLCKKIPVTCHTCKREFRLYTIRWYRQWHTGKVEASCGQCRRRIGIHKFWEAPDLVPAMVSVRTIPEDSM